MKLDGQRLHVGYPATCSYYVGMRCGVVPPLRSYRWYARLWRWLLKRNWRVASVDHARGDVTLRRSR